MLVQMTIFHSFYDWEVFHCVYVPHFLYECICSWTFRLFSSLALVNSTAMNIGVRVPFQIIQQTFISLWSWLTCKCKHVYVCAYFWKITGCISLEPPTSRCQDGLRHIRDILGYTYVRDKTKGIRSRWASLWVTTQVWNLWKERGKKAWFSKGNSNCSVAWPGQSQWAQKI